MRRVPSLSVLLSSAFALSAAACGTMTAVETSRQPNEPAFDKSANNGHITYAVIGDFPYGPVKRAEMPALIDKINSDPAVERVIHLGDIKAGSAADCSDAYFVDIRTQFDRFDDPFVYTPGDNEWTDCHVASKNNGLYTPTERLIAVRNVFFPVIGRTLGVHSAQVTSQAEVDPANAQYVENVLWTHANVVFATFNVTGSNDDKADWGTPLPADAANYPSQTQERATRLQANRAWLERTFERAKEAKAVVLALQADMWDGTLATRSTTIEAYDDLVVQIGTLSAKFGKPVLLLEGDSHVFRVDQPFVPTSPLFGLHPNTPVAPNVTRLVVNGSSSRTEYVRLTINPEAKDGNVFTFVEVPLS
ncbi:MAG TPA: hypothetical protein VIP11_01825 [Gemmatimonadaceae bacterium]